MSDGSGFRSPLLGEALDLDLAQGRLQAFRRGSGPPIVFAHGWLANANLWRGVVDRLSAQHTCIALDLPLGSHRVAMPAGADLSPAGVGELITAALDELELADVTLVGNDSGGAYAQVALAQRADRVGRLVLASCETPYDEFPPAPFDGLPAAAGDLETLGALLGALRDPAVRRLPAAFGLLAKHELDRAASDSYALPASGDPGVLRDVAKAMARASAADVRAAGAALVATFGRPVLLAWAREDPVFPVAHAERYATALQDARLVLIDDAYSFTAEDQPAALAAAIGAFAAPGRR